MNSKVWIRKALSLCLVVATMATYSMVALAGEKIAGELLISDQNAFVLVNGEKAQDGFSVLPSSTIVTPENTSAIINLDKIGKVELAPNTTLSLSFNKNSISGDLAAGRLTVLSAANAVTVKTVDGKTHTLNAGESATSGKVQDDDDDDDDGGAGALWFVIGLGGAITLLILAARSNNNRVVISNNSTVISSR